MTQLSVFTSSERASLPAVVRPVEATVPSYGVPASAPARSENCQECGTTVDVMFGTCAGCFTAWEVAT